MKSQEFKYANATVRVHRPDLAEDEKQKRMAEIKRTAEKTIKEKLKWVH